MPRYVTAGASACSDCPQGTYSNLTGPYRCPPCLRVHQCRVYVPARPVVLGVACCIIATWIVARPGGDLTNMLWLRGFISCTISTTRPDAPFDSFRPRSTLVCKPASPGSLRILALRHSSADLVTAAVASAYGALLAQGLGCARVARQGRTAS